MAISYDNSGAVDTKNIDVVTSQKYTYNDTGLSTAFAEKKSFDVW